MPLADGAGHTFLTGPGAQGSRSRNRVGYVFGLAGNRVLLAKIRHLAEDAAVARVEDEAKDGKARRYGEFRYAARTWPTERQVIGPPPEEWRVL